MFSQRTAPHSPVTAPGDRRATPRPPDAMEANLDKHRVGTRCRRPITRRSLGDPVTRLEPSWSQPSTRRRPAIRATPRRRTWRGPGQDRAGTRCRRAHAANSRTGSSPTGPATKTSRGRAARLAHRRQDRRRRAGNDQRHRRHLARDRAPLVVCVYLTECAASLDARNAASRPWAGAGPIARAGAQSSASATKRACPWAVAISSSALLRPSAFKVFICARISSGALTG